MPSMTREQLEALRSVDEETRWAVAEAYRAKVREGLLHLPCHRAAEMALARARPDLTDDQIGAVVTATILWISRDHQDWMRSE